MNRKLFLLAAIACLCAGGGGGVANAQLFIHVYPSQDHTNQTLWIFSGTSTTLASDHIRTSSGSNSYSARDSWRFASSPSGLHVYGANPPSDTNFQLSPLFSSTNTIDIDSVRKRIPGGGRTNITFAASATNTPTITFSSNSRAISHLFMENRTTQSDELGIRVSGSSNFSYSSGASSAWVGAGLINKPIGDFNQGEFHNSGYGGSLSPWFAASPSGSVRVVVNSQVIPEPEEYALVFGLFALGFVFFHRYFQKKKRRQQVPTL